MINDALLFLRNHVNAYVRAQTGLRPDESQEDKVVFVDGEKDPVSFKLGAVSVLLINVQEEPTLRAPDRYSRVAADGTRQQVRPEVRINLYVLFVARFKQYEEALRHLSLIIHYFQGHRVFNHHNAPELREGLEQLILELKTLSFAEQNEVWSSLRTTYHPSVLYKASLVIFRDEEARGAPVVEEETLKISQ
jgi:hypothetical protein